MGNSLPLSADLISNLAYLQTKKNLPVPRSDHALPGIGKRNGRLPSPGLLAAFYGLLHAKALTDSGALHFSLSFRLPGVLRILSLKRLERHCFG